ncbi:MAG: 16S rRNA (cytidine(1402)-2'-O)-methyltransferase [Candidatus Omnitrophica bacterium]|nr:16S rRNA (cytidine(1402)-2'-O)-methyltransferase [Candidatus Omnitrophota bacterium]
MSMDKGTLYIVSTPIGNLEDITLRAIHILKEVDLIAAEDTRKSKILLGNYNIQTPLTSYHSYNIAHKTGGLVGEILQGKNIAIISDSGTPGISDPGSLLISECIKKDIPVVAIPGPTALITALTVSGKPTHKFVFEGFLSNKSARRKKQLEALKQEERTVIIYESPHRIIKFLEDFIEVFGDRELVIARELTKKFEEIKRSKASLLLEHFSTNKPRGEFIVIF